MDSVEELFKRHEVLRKKCGMGMIVLGILAFLSAFIVFGFNIIKYSNVNAFAYVFVSLILILTATIPVNIQLRKIYILLFDLFGKEKTGYSWTYTSANTLVKGISLKDYRYFFPLFMSQITGYVLKGKFKDLDVTIMDFTIFKNKAPNSSCFSGHIFIISNFAVSGNAIITNSSLFKIFGNYNKLQSEHDVSNGVDFYSLHGAFDRVIFDKLKDLFVKLSEGLPDTAILLKLEDSKLIIAIDDRKKLFSYISVITEKTDAYCFITDVERGFDYFLNILTAVSS